MTASSMLEQELNAMAAKFIAMIRIIGCFILLDYYFSSIDDIDTFIQIGNRLSLVFVFPRYKTACRLNIFIGVLSYDSLNRWI